MKKIPIDQLQNKTNKNLQIKAFKAGDVHKNNSGSQAHRDDHYIFFLLTKGSGTLQVDTRNIVLVKEQIFYILPSQVHNLIQTDHAEGWFLAVDVSLIPAYSREVFEQGPGLQSPRTLTTYQLMQYTGLLEILHSSFVQRDVDKYYLPIIHSLAQSFLAMAASTFGFTKNTDNTHSRSAELVHQFKKLLAANIYKIKSPAAYASKLNVSPGYLNETLKKITGSTVSHWIQQEMVTEAKRLLHYSDADVKQISLELGYTNFSYFCRLFRRLSGMSPLKFRETQNT